MRYPKAVFIQSVHLKYAFEILKIQMSGCIRITPGLEVFVGCVSENSDRTTCALEQGDQSTG
jgi:hypothetical protein